MFEVRGISLTAYEKPRTSKSRGPHYKLTPVLNTQTRTDEYEADKYGLDASRQPDGFAQAAIHLGEYRKMNPGRVEE